MTRRLLGFALAIGLALTPAYGGEGVSAGGFGLTDIGGTVGGALQGGGSCGECGDLACCGDPKCCVSPNFSFECGDLTDWTAYGDVAVLDLDPCLQPQLPSDDCFAACMSTEDLFGGQAIGGVRSDLITSGLDVNFKPDSIIVEFDFDYGTDETLQMPDFNDSFDVTLQTGAGPFPLMAANTWGISQEAGRVKRLGGEPFFLLNPNPGCPVARQTGRASVLTKTKIPSNLQSAVRSQQVFVQFTVSDQSSQGGLTFVCIDNVRVRIKKKK